MKLHFVFLSTLVCVLLAGCQKKSNTITIVGQLEGVEDSTILTLGAVDNRMLVDVAHDTVFNGKFKFILEDTTGLAKEMTITSSSKGFPPTWLSIWVAPGELIKITGKDKLLRTWDVKSFLPQQQELNLFKNKTETYQRSTQLIMTEAYAQFDSMNVYPERRNVFRARVDSLYALNDSLNDLIMKTEVDMLGDHKTYSEVWMDKLNSYTMCLRYMPLPEDYVDKMRALYEGIPENQKNSTLGESIYLSLNLPKVVGIGDEMADTDMWDLHGNLHRLENFKGKYILLDFWSAGCGPCIMSMPEMKEISEEYKDRLTVVSISSDSKEVWTRVSEEKGVSWTNLNDFKGDNGIKLRYGVTGIPHYVMISPEGELITTWTGYGKGLLKKKVEEWVK